MNDPSVLIVSYNTRELTLACVASVLAHRDDLDPEVVVVDNASTDGSVEALRARFPDITVVPASENLGFARAANLAARQASGEHLVLLNPDATVHPGALAALVGFARRHPEHGLYGGRNLWPDGRVITSSCRSLPTPWSLVCFGTGLSSARPASPRWNPEELPGWDRDSVREVGMLSGSLLLITREAWDRLGGFDETFFMYGEDSDLCLRAARLGYRPVFVPDATVTHVVGASSPSGRRNVLKLSGRATYVRKHWRAPARALGLAMLHLGVAVRTVGTARRGGDDAWREAWQERRTWRRGYADPDPTGPDGSGAGAGAVAGPAASDVP